jgi:Tfp pilus assembly protein PilN
MRAVNLLPAPRVEQRQDDGQSRARTTKAVAIIAAVVLGLVAAVLGYSFSHSRSQVNDRTAKLDGLKAEVARAQAAAAVPGAARATTQSHLAAITSAASGRIAWDGLLGELSRVMPAGAWLQTLQAGNGASTTSSSSSSSTTPSTSTTTASAPATAVAGAVSTTGAMPTSFVVSGYALSQDIVALALDRLALMPGLSDVSLQSTQRASVGGTPGTTTPGTTTGNATDNTNAVQFTISANVRSAGGNG